MRKHATYYAPFAYGEEKGAAVGVRVASECRKGKGFMAAVNSPSSVFVRLIFQSKRELNCAPATCSRITLGNFGAKVGEWKMV